MSGQTNITTPAATPATCGAETPNQENTSASLGKHKRTEELRFSSSTDQQPSENESVKSEDDAIVDFVLVQDIAAKPETPTKDASPEDLTAGSGAVQALAPVSDENTHPTTVVRITDDQKVPEDVMRLINGKSPDEVVHIIHGQMAELKALETLRDVEEECLDELTNDIIAKITKETIL